MIPKIEFKAAVKKQKKFKNKKKKKINLNSRNKPQYECTKFPDENIKIPKTDRKPLGVGSESYYVFLECQYISKYERTIKSLRRLFAVFDGFLTADFIANSRYEHYRDSK